MNEKYGILVICTAISLLCFVGPASATTWSVDGSGGADFTRIQDAINNASAGDTIIVHSGVYYENVVVDKSVTLKGNDQPVVDASGEGDAIRLDANGITLEGFTATGSSMFDAGIKVILNNNTITGNTVCNNRHNGISLSFSCNNTITGNNVSNNNDDGIYLRFSSNNTITGNNVCNNSRDGIFLHYFSNNNSVTGNTHVNDGLFLASSYHNTVEENTVNSKPLVYLEDTTDYTVEDAGQVILVNCSNITVENLDLSNTTVGIVLWNTEDSTIANNKVYNNSRHGIYLYNSRNNIITGNTVCHNDDDGIHLESSSNNIIIGNNVCNNNDHGISLLYMFSEDNLIYLNNFIDNTDNVYYSFPWATIWNSKEEITYTYNGNRYISYLGNYWDDYEEKYPDAEEIDSTGIWDTPYSIYKEYNKDFYPLVEPRERYIP